MHAGSSIELVEIANGMAIAAAVREIADSSCRSHLRLVVAPSCLLHGITSTRTLLGGSLAAMACEAKTRPWKVISFEELLSETGQYIAGLWGTLPYPVL